MPSTDFYPRLALLTTFDARPWAGVTVATGPNNITLPAYSATGEGIFRDAVDFLNGRQAPIDWSVPDGAQDEWTGGGAPVFSAGIDSDDRVYVEADTQDFTVSAASEWGFSALTASTGAGPYRVTADTDWTRGLVTQRLEITPVGGGAAYYVPLELYQAQSIPVQLRSADPLRLSDADSVPYASTLQGVDDTANGGQVWWGLDDDGHVFRAYAVAVAPPVTALVWVDTDFRDRLGFTGSEVVVSAGGLNVLTAARPCPGVVVPSRPAESCIAWTDVDRSSSRSIAGALAHVERSRLQGVRLSWFLDGLNDVGSTDDLWAHYLRRWLPYAGDLVTLYQEWGDTRRRGFSTLGDTYGVLRTAQDYHGRIIGRWAPSEGTMQALELTDRLRIRSPIVSHIAEVPDA